VSGKALNRRGLPKGTPRVNGLNERELRRVRAEARRHLHEQLTPYEQRCSLDARLGTNEGAAEERARLAEREEDGERYAAPRRKRYAESRA
jgi:hypothetical protein